MGSALSNRRQETKRSQTVNRLLCCPRAEVIYSFSGTPCVVEQAAVLPCDVLAARLCATLDLPPFLPSPLPFPLIHASLGSCFPLSTVLARKFASGSVF